MKKFMALMLTIILAISLVACSTNTKEENTNQEPVETGAYEKLYDFINENGAEMTGYNALTAAVDDSYISIIAKSESTIELMLLSETEVLATKVSIILSEDEKEHKVSLVSKIDGEMDTYGGCIDPKTYDTDSPEILSFKSASPQDYQEEEKKALAAAVNYTLTMADVAMEKTPVTLKDLGYEKFSQQ